jgi:hypothetical protein
VRAMRRWLPLVMVLAIAGPAFGQSEPAPEAPPAEDEVVVQQPGGGEVVFKRAPERPLDTTRRSITVKGAPRPGRDSKDATPLKGARALSVKDGVARMQLVTGEEIALAPGVVLGTDTVKSVDATRIVLERSPSADTGEALVVVSLGAGGATRLRVYFTKDPDVRPEFRLN